MKEEYKITLGTLWKGNGQVKLRKTDRLYTRYIRLLYGFTCQRCGRVYSPDDCRNLGVSHFWGRGHENTRFDDENCIPLCTWNCHRVWGHGEGRDEYKQFMIDKLGQEGFDLLDLRAHTYKKRDDKLDEIIIKAKIKELEDHDTITFGRHTLVHMD